MHGYIESSGLETISTIYGQCICCLKEGTVKNMVEQMSSGEIIIQVFMLCFGLDMLAADIGDRKPSICAACEVRLRDASDFRRQVERALQVLGEQVAVTEYSDAPVQVEEDKVQFHTKQEQELDVTYDDPGNSDYTPAVHNMKTKDLDSDDDLLLSAYKKLQKIENNKKPRVSWIARATNRMKRKTILAKAPDYPTVDEMTEFISAGLFPLKGLRRNKYECLICKKKFKDLALIGQHWSVHGDQHKNLKIKAIKRMIRLDLSSQFKIVGAKLKCKLCQDLIPDLSNMYHHGTNCTKSNTTGWRQVEVPYKLKKDQRDCPECKEVFINSMNLKRHMNVHFPNFMCEVCGKAFATKARLRGHSRVHVKGEFPCKHCNKVFDKVTKRENHMAYEHKGGSRYSCPRCEITVSSFYTRQKHLAEAHDEQLKRYKCSSCPISYITPGHLSSHVRRVHLNERNHKCEKCEQAFYTKHSLRMHMISHDGQRIHSCQLCGKSYQRAKTLREHMRIHNNDKRFVCPLCGRAFTQKCTLTGHLRTHDRAHIL